LFTDEHIILTQGLKHELVSRRVSDDMSLVNNTATHHYPRCERGNVMARAAARKKRLVRRGWTHAEVKELKQYSKDKTRVKTISRALKRTPGALRQKARVLGIPLGHRRSKSKGA
jgi:hypothetical protein